MDMSKNKPSRKLYNKPVVQEVRLRIKEAVLDISCETLSATGTYARDGIESCVLDSNPCLTP
jgi:hypothetical protein